MSRLPWKMRVRPDRARLLAALVMGMAGMLGCNLLGGPSKVKAGELVETGEARYDAYFKEVHDLQVAATGWNDDRKAACRGLVDALKLSPDAADVSIVQATHERVNQVARDVGPIRLEVTSDDAHLTAGNAESVDDTTRELFRAIEICAHAESQRAKNLRVIPPKVDGLNKTGRELEPHVREDFGRRGGRVGMDVQQEMVASYSALESISRDARNGARGAEDFVADLQRAIVTDGPLPDPTPDRTAKGKGRPEKADRAESKNEAKAESKPTAKAETKRAAASSSTTAERTPPKPARPAEKPKPKPPPASEVFNP